MSTACGKIFSHHKNIKPVHCVTKSGAKKFIKKDSSLQRDAMVGIN